MSLPRIGLHGCKHVALVAGTAFILILSAYNEHLLNFLLLEASGTVEFQVCARVAGSVKWILAHDMHSEQKAVVQHLFTWMF